MEPMKSEVIHVRIDAGTLKKLKAEAKKQSRKLSNLAALLIKNGLL
jgi:hypothetical protein